MTHPITLTPAQRQRLQVILAVWWAEMLACEPSLEEPEDQQLLAIIGTEGTADERS